MLRTNKTHVNFNTEGETSSDIINFDEKDLRW